MIRTFIYGSCVSRDTFEYLDKGEFSLLRYVARSSLVSAFSPPGPVPLAQGHGLSPFQLRQVETDAASGLLPLLRELADRVDLLLWDLCDERMGLFDVGDGRVVTRSVELLRAQTQSEILNTARLIDFGTDEHLSRFQKALERFAAHLDQSNLLGKILLVAPRWAEEDDAGRGDLKSFGRSAEWANDRFKEYNHLVGATIGCPVLGHDIKTIADTAHKWGRAPFHYAQPVYTELAREITNHRP